MAGDVRGNATDDIGPLHCDRGAQRNIPQPPGSGLGKAYFVAENTAVPAKADVTASAVSGIVSRRMALFPLSSDCTGVGCV